MKKTICNTFWVLLILASCTSKDHIPAPSSGLLHRGTDSLKYTYYAPLADRPVVLYYHIPEDGDIRTMPILFAMHGSERDAKYQIDTWKNIANQRQIMVFAPCFTRELYPGNRAYQFAGVSDSDYTWLEKSQDKWTISLIENLFDFIKAQTSNGAATYDLWGHSAGAQFSHRLLFFLPEARVRMVVSSNAGSYLMPTLTGYGTGNYGFPHSLKGTPYTANDLTAYFARPLIVHLGTADIATTAEQDSALPVSVEAKAQGASRFERGHYFFNFAKEAAEAASVHFNWRLVEVAGVAHNSRRMAQTDVTGAADLLYPDR